MRVWAKLGLVALALAAFDQLVQFTLLRDGFLFGRRIAPYDPPLFSDGQIDALTRVKRHLASGEPLASIDFDPELGWSTPKGGGSGEYRRDWAGARIAFEPLRREKQAGVRRIVLVGDSFTLGMEVGAQESWAARLAAVSKSNEIANLGVGAYGADQTLLRLERNALPLAPDEIWFGLVPSTAARNVTQYLPALKH